MARPSVLERLGLHRPELRAWAAYDWANSAFVCVVVTAVFFVILFGIEQVPGDDTGGIDWTADAVRLAFQKVKGDIFSATVGSSVGLTSR